jgi:hypothetical protein
MTTAAAAPRQIPTWRGTALSPRPTGSAPAALRTARDVSCNNPPNAPVARPKADQKTNQLAYCVAESPLAAKSNTK